MTDYLEHRVKLKFKKYFTAGFKIFFMIIAAIIFALLLGYAIMWLWNWLMPDIFGLTTITYWQAVGIFALTRVFFGSFGEHKSRSRGEKNTKRRCRSSKHDFSKWKFYDQYWEEEGQSAFDDYIERMQQNNTQENDTTSQQ